MSQQNVCISHCGHVNFDFQKNVYVRVSGTDNWSVQPIEAFDPPIRVPVGQIEITFKDAVHDPYTVLVTAKGDANTPLLNINYRDSNEKGFVIHLWETIADRTLQNGSFSFAVLTTG